MTRPNPARRRDLTLEIAAGVMAVAYALAAWLVPPLSLFGVWPIVLATDLADAIFGGDPLAFLMRAWFFPALLLQWVPVYAVTRGLVAALDLNRLRPAWLLGVFLALQGFAFVAKLAFFDTYARRLLC